MDEEGFVELENTLALLRRAARCLEAMLPDPRRKKKDEVDAGARCD